MVRLAHGGHQAVRSPHGEVDGEHQTEPQHIPAGGLAHIEQVALQHVQHPAGEQVLQAQDDARHVQLQQPQQAAEEDHQREEHEQQIVGQRRSLMGHGVVEIAVHRVGKELPHPGGGYSF